MKHRKISDVIRETGVFPHISGGDPRADVETFEDLAASIREDLEIIEGRASAAIERKHHPGTSRFVSPHSDPEIVRTVADGGSYRTVEPQRERGYGRGAKSGLGYAVKALAEGTAAAGGLLVRPEIADEVLRSLRARSAVYNMGVSRIDVKKLLSVLAISSGAAANYVAEGLSIPVSEPTFSETALLAPKMLAALVPVSNRLLRDADDPSIEAVIREDLAEVMSLRADFAFLMGTGASETPKGIYNVSGVQTVQIGGTDGGQPTFPELKGVVGQARAANAPFSSPGWVAHPDVISLLDSYTDADGHPLGKSSGELTIDATGAGGTLLSYPFRTTTQLPVNEVVGASNDCTTMIFSPDWREAWLGEESTFTLDMSSEASYVDLSAQWHSTYQKMETLFRCYWAHDIGLRRPQLFWKVTGIKTEIIP